MLSCLMLLTLLETEMTKEMRQCRMDCHSARMHHAAFDHNIIGITPDFDVQVRQDILEEIDGPNAQVWTTITEQKQTHPTGTKT